MTKQKPVGLLIMAYGTPASLDEVEAYYTHIRRGRPPSPEQLADLIGRYQAIGGVSPLTEITAGQANGIAEAVQARTQRSVALYIGMKHTHPFIEEAVDQMIADGVREAVTLVLAPHYSTMSVAVYQKNVEDAASGRLALTHISQWYDDPTFLDVLAARVSAARDQLPHSTEAMVLFTAHSLPERITTVGDPYPQQLQDTGHAVAERLGLRSYDFAWQSAGRTPEPWLGPDLLDKLRSLHASGVTEVVVCPCGFVSDHLEVLYDVDIEAQNVAQELGMKLVRTQSLNTDPDILNALAKRVVDASATLHEARL